MSTNLNPVGSGLTQADRLIAHGLRQLELSGGEWHKEIRPALARAKVLAHIQFHNYLPLHPSELVVNLASQDEVIRRRSTEHLRELIRLTAEFRGKWLSVHAGFAADPEPASLGERWILRNQPLPLEEAYDVFWEGLQDLAQYAVDFGVGLLVENNVLTRENLKIIGPEALLLADPSDIPNRTRFFPPGVGLLVDVAHLLISAQTFGSSQYARALKLPEVQAYHLSRSDGLYDTGGALTGDESFWDYLSRQVAFVTLEVKSERPSVLSSQRSLVEQRLAQ